MKQSYKKNQLVSGWSKKVVFVLFTILLILCMWILISDTVMCQSEESVTVDEEAFQVLESDYLKAVKQYLNARGFQNSGVSLNRIVDENGSRSYHITLHHRHMHKLTEEEQEMLTDTIEEMGFEIAFCDFRAEIMN